MNVFNFLYRNSYLFFYWVILVFVCFFWNFEEPNKFFTLLNASIIYFSGIILIYKFDREKKILNVNLWILVYFLKIIISIFLLYYFIAKPLIPLDKLRSSFQDPMLTDSNFYDYVALEIKNNGFFSSYGLLFSTWLSFGIIFYVFCVYYILGTSILYIAFVNSLLILVSALYLSSIVKSFVIDLNNNVFSLISLIILLPYSMYYDLTASKETLSVFGLTLFFYQLSKVINTSKVNLNGLYFSLFLVLFVRPNLGILIIPISLYYLRQIISYKRLLITTLTLLVGIYFFIELTIGVQSIISAYADVNRVIESQQENASLVSNGSSVKNFIFNFLAPVGFFKTIFFVPFRAIIWFLLPFPFIFFDIEQFFLIPNLLSTNWNLYYRIPEGISRLLSTHLIICSLPFFLITFKKKINNNGFLRLNYFICLIFIVLTVALSTFNFANGGRYRIVIEPFYFSLVIIGMYFSKKQIKWIFNYYILYFIFFIFLNIIYSIMFL